MSEPPKLPPETVTAEAEPKPGAGIKAIFGIGASGRSDVSSHIDEYAGEAAAWNLAPHRPGSP
jgi:hypothetical protein